MNILDLRMLPVAAALWCGAVIGLHTSLGVAFLPTIAVIGVAAVLSALRSRHLALWCAALLVGTLAAALRVDAAAPQAVQQALSGVGAVSFTARIDEEPRLIEMPGFGGLQVQQVVRARVTLLHIRFRDRTWQTSIPATLQWPQGGVPRAVGEVVAARAVLHDDDPVGRSTYRATLASPPRVVRTESRADWWATAVRHGLAEAVHAQSGGAGASLLPGLVLGDTRAQSPQLVEDLRTSGLSHLTAVSGANLAIVIAAVAWMLRRTRLPMVPRHLVALTSIAGFVLVVQPQPSVLRAAVMGSISVIALWMGERSTGASVLWLSVVALLLIDPFLAWQYGFALSVAATAGLIVLRPFLLPLLPTGPIGDALAITLSAQVATFPVLVAMGRTPTLLSIPANLICEPLVAPATIFGFAAALMAAIGMLPGLATIALPAAAVIAIPGVAIAEVIARIAAFGASSPLAVSAVPSGRTLVLMAGIGIALRLFRIPVRWSIAALTPVVVLASCSPQMHRGWPPEDWWYAMCDVGQGDATVFNLGSGSAMVVDAGPDPALVRGCLRDLRVHHVEVLFITHFHADHVEGMRGLVQQARVGSVYATPLHEPQVEWLRTRALLPQPMQDLQMGSVLQIGRTTVHVLWPDPSRLDGSPNNASLVLDVERRGVHVLVTGDADAAAQAAMRLPVRGYAVLKVAHHGSRYQDPGFVDRVAPALALISVGADNDYGHPAAITLQSLAAVAVPVLRTDRVGAIAIVERAGRLTYVVSG